MPPESRHATRPAHANRHAAGTRFLAEVIERVVGQRLDVNGELGIVQIDRPPPGFLDPAADLAFDLRRRQRKPLVRSARRDPERSRIRHVPSRSARMA